MLQLFIKSVNTFRERDVQTSEIPPTRLKKGGFKALEEPLSPLPRFYVQILVLGVSLHKHQNGNAINLLKAFTKQIKALYISI